MRTRVRVNLTADPNAVEALQYNLAFNTAALSVEEYNRVRIIATNYKKAQFMGASSSVKRVGDTLMVAAAHGTPVVLDAMTMVSHQGPRIQCCDDKYVTFNEISGNIFGIDAATNVKVVPRRRSGVKITKWSVPANVRKGKYIPTINAFPAPSGSALPPEYLAATCKSLMQKFTGLTGGGGSDTIGNASPGNLVTQLDSYPIPPLPTASGSSIISNASITLEYYTNWWFALYGNDIAPTLGN